MSMKPEDLKRQLQRAEELGHKMTIVGVDELKRLLHIHAEARRLVNILHKVGEETDWEDSEETDRVFTWYEFTYLDTACRVFEEAK